MSYSIIITKNDEDISWIDNLDKEAKIFIYTKNNETYKDDKYTNIKILNIKGESYTYLYHIINNYHNLTDIIIFIRGYYQDHNVKNLYHKVNDFSSVIEKDFIIKQYNLSFYQWMKIYIEKNIEKYDFKYKPDRCFSTVKQNILSRPLDFYKMLIKQLDMQSPEIEYFFEKAWYFIFNVHKMEIIKNPDFIVVGAGISGATIAQQLAQLGKVLVIEKRDHLAGNCYDYIDEKTGILVSKYGAHIFHTKKEEVWKYVNRFSQWKEYHHKVYGKLNDTLFPIPINRITINILCHQNLKNEEEVKQYLENVRDKSINEPKNGEEFCLSIMGKDLYENIFKHYTYKQWNKYPNELDVSVLKRIPIRYDDSEGYFTDPYQALPINGYAKMVENMFNNANIYTLYNTDFHELKFENKVKVFYTGPIDIFYKNLSLPKLEYRSIDFQWETLENINYFQNNSVINYPGPNEKFTRIVEYKHFFNSNTPHTIISKEYTTDQGEPYYPVPNKYNQDNYELYRSYTKNSDVIFLGRLATYKYYNMDDAIHVALETFSNFITSTYKINKSLTISYHILNNKDYKHKYY